MHTCKVNSVILQTKLFPLHFCKPYLPTFPKAQSNILERCTLLSKETGQAYKIRTNVLNCTLSLAVQLTATRSAQARGFLLV